jgi:hypothetical protein
MQDNMTDLAHELAERVPAGLGETAFRACAAAFNAPGIWSMGRYSQHDINRAWTEYSLAEELYEYMTQAN